MHWYRAAKSLEGRSARKIAKIQKRIGKLQGRIERLQRGRTHGYPRAGLLGLPGMRLLRGLVWAGMWIVERLESRERGGEAAHTSGPVIEGAPLVPTSHQRTFWTFGRRSRT